MSAHLSERALSMLTRITLNRFDRLHGWPSRQPPQFLYIFYFFLFSVVFLFNTRSVLEKKSTRSVTGGIFYPQEQRTITTKLIARSWWNLEDLLQIWSGGGRHFKIPNGLEILGQVKRNIFKADLPYSRLHMCFRRNLNVYFQIIEVKDRNNNITITAISTNWPSNSRSHAIFRDLSYLRLYSRYRRNLDVYFHILEITRITNTAISAADHQARGHSKFHVTINFFISPDLRMCSFGVMDFLDSKNRVNDMEGHAK